MPEGDARVVRDLADLQMQVNALQVAAKNESLVASMKETRVTMRWSAIVIAAALVISSTMKLCGDSRVETLEKQVQALERRVQALEPSRPPAQAP